MPTHHHYVRVLVGTSFIKWKFQTIPYQSSETTSRNNNVTGAGETTRTTNYELLRKDWATRAPVAQTLQSVRQTSPRTTTTCAYLLVQVSSSGNCKSKPVLTIFSIQLIGFYTNRRFGPKQTMERRVEMSRSLRMNLVKRVKNTTTHHHHMLVHLVMVSIE